MILRMHRYEIMLESYCKTVQVEALTAIKMLENQIYPAGLAYLGKISETSIKVKNNGINNKFLVSEIKELAELLNKMKDGIGKLKLAIEKARLAKKDINKSAHIWKDEVMYQMHELRKIADVLETKVSLEFWPIPTYMDLLFGI